MDDELRQALYLIADEMRGMATTARVFTRDPYVAEQAERYMGLAARLAALVDTAHDEAETLSAFSNPDLLRVSPAIGADAAVFNARGDILLIRRRDDDTWALPGGIDEIGDTPSDAVLKELWEEAGLRGRVLRLLGIFDAQRWGSRSPIHHVNIVYEVACDDLHPAPGLEATDARFFPVDALPLDNMHPNHVDRVPKVIEMRARGECYVDPADSRGADLPNHQRPE